MHIHEGIATNYLMVYSDDSMNLFHELNEVEMMIIEN
jgi:hypothetical protein